MKIVKLILITLIVFVCGNFTMAAQSKSNSDRSTQIVRTNKKANKNKSRKKGSPESLERPIAKTMKDKKEAKRQRQSRVNDVIEKNKRRKKKESESSREEKIKGKKKTKSDN